MKKFQKYISTILLLTLLISLIAFPTTFAATKSSFLIGMDDFEGYEEGITFNEEGTHTLGGWSFTIPSDSLGKDIVSIVKDPTTNNKALKIVKGTSTSALDMVFNFPSTTSGKIRVSYDVRFQNHSKYLEAWGEVGGAAAPYKEIYMHATNFTNPDSGTLVILSNLTGYSNTLRYTIEQYCDFENSGYNIEAIEKTNSTRRTGKSATSDCEEISKVSFKLKTLEKTDPLYSRNGKSTDADTDGNPDNNGIYWIDNIKVENIADISMSLSLSDDLEGYAEGLTFNTAGRHTLGNWEFMIPANSSDSVTIATDPVTNSKALKIVKSSTGDLKIHYVFGSITGGKAKAKFDARIENHSKSLTSIGQMQNNNTVIRRLLFVKYVYFMHQNGGTNITTINDSYPNKWLSCEETLDFDNKNIAVQVMNNAGDRTPEKTNPITAEAMDRMYFQIDNNATYKGVDEDEDKDNNPDNNGIYWIDNVSVEKIPTVNADVVIADGKINLSAGIKNSGPSSLLIVKITNNLGEIVDLDIKNVKGDNDSYENEYTIEGLAEDYTLNYYLWENFGSLRPLIVVNEE